MILVGALIASSFWFVSEKYIVSDFFASFTRERPRVVDVTPTGLIEDDMDRLQVTFSRPMVPEDNVGELQTDPEIRLDPSMDEAVIWHSPKSAEIVARESIPRGTFLKIIIPVDMTDIDGRRLASEHVSELKYKPLSDFEVRRVSHSPPELHLTLRTDAPTDWSEMRQHLTIKDEAGDTVYFEIDDPDADNDDQLSHRVVLSEQAGLSGQTLEITLSEGLIPTGGNIPTEKEFVQEHTVGKVQVRQISSTSRDNQPVVSIRFNHDFPQIRDSEKYFLINGKKADRLETRRWRRSQIYVFSDELDWGDEVEVEISKDIDFGFYELKEPVTDTITMDDADPMVGLGLSREMKNWGGGGHLPVEHVNADTLHITVFDLHKENLVHFANEQKYSTGKRDWFKEQESLYYELPGEKNEFRRDHIELQELVDQDWSGVKKVMVSDLNTHRTETYLLVLTDLGLTVHRGNDHVTVMTTELETAQPAAGVEVDLYSRANTLLGSAVTDQDGLAEISDLEPEEVTVALARREQDVNYLVLEEGSLGTGDFDVHGDPYPEDDELDALIYGERELYRPGETLLFQALIRSHDLTRTASQPITATIYNADGDKIYENTHEPDDYGRIDIEQATPLDAPTGRYRLYVSRAHNDERLAEQDFQVEEFVPDRIEANVEALTEMVATGDTVDFRVTGTFLHGEPTAGNKVQNQFRLSPLTYSSERYPDYSFGDSRIDFDQIWESLDDEKLDDDGQTTVSFPVDEDYRPPSLLELTLESTVLDMGARGVTARDSLKISPYPFYLGSRFPHRDPEHADPGDTVTMSLTAVDMDDRDVTGLELDFTLYEIQWRYSLEEQNGRVSYDWQREEIPLQEKSIKLDRTTDEIDFQLPYETRYQVVVEDPESGSATVQDFSVGRWWLRGDGRRVDFDRLDLELDRDRYAPGEEAHVHLQAPFDGNGYVFLEGQETEFLKRLEISDEEAEFAIPVRAGYAPNRYLVVYVIRDVYTDGSPAFRSLGIEPLKVDVPERQIDLEIDPAGELQPGETVPIHLTAQKQGSPVNGVVALSVVDEGILQQTEHEFEDAYRRFLRQRGLPTSFYDIYSLLVPEEELPPGERLHPPGGEPRLAEAVAEPEEEVEDVPDDVEAVETIHDWYPDLYIEDGEATVDLPVPEFSGLLTFRAWSSSQFAVGSGEDKATVQEPIIMEPTLPRALSPGDRFSLPVEIMNTTEKTEEIEVKLTSEFPLRTEPESRTTSLSPGERTMVYFDSTVDTGLGNVKLTLSLNSAVYERERQEILPVRPAVPPTVLTDIRRLEADTEWHYSPPQRLYPSTESHQFMFSSRPGAEVFGPLTDLIRYPRGNVSTIVERAFPQLYLRDLLEAADWDRDRQEEIEMNVEEAIERLLRLSLPDGYFPRYPGHDQRHDYTTQQTAHFLVEADRAGYVIPELALDQLLNTQRSLLENKDQNDRARARAAYILARAGDYRETIAEKLLEEFDGYENYYLLAALALAGREKPVEEYARVKPPDLEEVGRRTRGWYTCTHSARASVLMAMLEVDPEHVIVEQLAIKIMNNLESWGDRRWRYWVPRSLSRGLVALGRYFEVTQPEDPDFDGRLLLDNNPVLEFDSDADTVYHHAGGFDDALVELTGQGTALAYHYALGVPRPQYREEREQDFHIRHRYLDSEGNQIEDRKFEQGKIYVIESYVTTPVRQEDLYVEDMLPGGFELENQRLASDVMEVPALEEGDSPNYMDVRDDRMLLYFDSGRWGNNYRFRYAVRAVSQGKFVAPALAGGALHDPSVGYLSFRDPVIIE